MWPNEELQQRADDLAHELAAVPSIAVAGVLKCIVDAGEKSLEEAIAEERRAVVACMGTPDAKEGMRAFLEKRPPQFHTET